MNYSGNMPDWHQYNPPQSGINEVTSTAQNVNSGHLPFISSISPTQLNHSLNLNTEGHEKHQNDSTFNPRHFQPHLSGNISHGHNAADNTPLASMVQMQNCIGHYGPSNTRNPMVDNLNGPMDPRNTAIGGLNEELGYRNNQVPLNGPISHLNGPNVMNMNAPHQHGSIGPRNTNVNSHTTNRAAPPSFVSCKGLCCNPDPNISYQQWEKYCSYQNNTTYRENIRTSGYQADTRRFGNDFNFRKDNFDGKEVLPPPIVPNAPNADHQRNFPDYKYRKNRLLSRSYPPASGMLQNYPMQNYNYTGEYQKYPYNVKEYSKMNNMNIPSQGMVKHQEQGFMAQQKYNNKQQQVPYQNSGMMSTSMPSTSMPSASVNTSMMPSAQNAYFNPTQYPRNLPTESAHDCQEVADNVSMVNRMPMSNMHPPSHSRYQVYQQKIAMQRFSMENQLRELARVPGYQTHPRYKECLLKYRELLKLQQTVTYQGQMQQTPCVAASTSVSAVSAPPINLQFDQNGVLINSNYMPEAFPRVQQVLNPQAPVDGSDKQNKPESNGIPDMVSHSVHKSQEQQLVVPQQQQHDAHAAALCPDSLQKQDRYPVQKSLEPNVQFEVQQKTGNESFSNLNDSPGDTATTQQKISKEFADKPELDVRQFLANWDESEDEDGASSNMQNVVLSNSTPVVVVGYENVNLSAKTLEGLKASSSKPEEVPSGVIAFKNQEKSDTAVVSAQDCLTISYSAAKNVEIAKDACKEIVEVAKESIVQSGSIIQCISNGPDEVPTIHIVDNLEIGSILQVTNGQVTETLERQKVPFFHEGTEVEASAIALEADKFKKTDVSDSTTSEYNADLEKLSKEKYIVESSPPKTVESTSQTSQVVNDHQEELALSTPAKDNLDSAAESINLKKQSSFTSEESHNPDDISLPDLPTSECTPISTTLNTPIHSDSEESSERVEDLTIPTNPIEVVQNSPIISFTQSPMRGDPYDHLNDEAGGVKSKSANSLENRYQPENHFDGEGSNNMLHHDNVLSTFEFSADIDKNESTKRDNKERVSPSGSNTSIRDERTFPLDGETANAEMTGMCMTLTSGEYELKIVSTGMQSKSARDDKNSTVGRRASESQTIVGNDAQEAHKKLRTFAESSAKTTLQYGNSTEELDKALRNIASGSDRRDAEDDVNYADSYEARLLKMTRSESKSCTMSVNKRNCISTESAHQTVTSAIDSSLANDATSRGSRPVEDGCPSKTIRNNISTSHSTKRSILGNDKLRKSETADRPANSPAERHGTNRTPPKVDTRDSRNSRHVSRHISHRKSTSGDHVDLRGKRYENIVEKCSEAIVHHNKHTHETTAHKVKSRAVEDLKEASQDVACNEPKTTTTTTTTNKIVDENRERLRLLKEYRRIKYKPPGVAEIPSKSKDTQQEIVVDHSSGKKCHIPMSSCDERHVSQLLNDKQLCPKDASFKPSEEQDRKHAILKTFVNKNVNPDFAIQVTNVNLKLKDNDHQKELQYLGKEEAKNSGALDAIKIEINVSCTERNTTEKLLHENIKNAVAETIGHLTSSISSGARSSGSANLKEIQCDKKMICDQAANPRDKSPLVSANSAYDDLVHKAEQDNVKTTKYKSAISTSKGGAMNDEASGALGSKKRSLSPEREMMNNVYEVKDNVNVETELAPNAPEISKTEHAPIRRRSVQQEADQVRKVVAANFPANSEESKASSDNSLHTGSTSRGANAQKKDHQEATAAILCRNARNSQDNVNSRLNVGASTSSSAADPDLQSTAYDNNSAHFDYDHFDVAPNENTDADDKRADKWKRPRRDDGRFNNLDLYDAASGYMNPIFFSVDELGNMNTVPVYTTKDGKITYSPNPRFTYHELLMEARAKEGYGNTREPYFARSPSFDYYNCSKLRKVFKRNRDATAVRKREVDPTDAKPQFASKHVDYLPNKITAHHAKNSRNALHLEFFNDDADKLYASRSDQQESKEGGKKSVVDLNFLEKQCNPDGDSRPNIKHCRTKALAENLEKNFEKGCNNENPVFDPNIFLEPRALCWEETMESVKSYSSHIDRRNSGNRKELNFSEIFAKQKRLDSAFSFLHTEQVSLDGDSNHKANNDNCDTVSESPTLGRTSGYASDDLHSTRHDDSRCEQSDTVARNERENTNDDRNDVLSTTDVREKSPSAHDALLHDEYAKEQQFDHVETASTVLAEEAPPCSPEVVDDKVHALEKEDCPTNPVQDSTLTEPSVVDNNSCVPSNEDQPSAEEDAIVKEASGKNSAEVTSQSESNADHNDLPDEPKCTETVEEPVVPAADERAGEIDDSAKTESDSTANGEVVAHQEVSTAADREDEEEVPSAAEPNVAVEICFNDETSEQDTRGKENPTVCREEEEILASRNPSDVAAVSLGEENDEQKSQKPQDNERLAESPPKDPGIDEVDDCGVPTLFESAATLDLQPVRPEEDVCDIFVSEKREQNISEFTVIKSIIQADKRQCEEPETRETDKDHDSIIDSKLLCMDSSDCGIYEARCALMQISEHDFTEDDSMVPMEWETSQIQEDAVNRLCGIDESSIDFAAAANSLRDEDNSLLDNLSLSRSAMKEPRLLELPAEVMSKADESVVLAAEPTTSPPLPTSPPPPLPTSPPPPLPTSPPPPLPTSPPPPLPTLPPPPLPTSPPPPLPTSPPPPLPTSPPPPLPTSPPPPPLTSPPPPLPTSPPPPVLEKIQAAPCHDEDEEQKEQNPVSSSSYEKVAYLSATDCNANTKIVPKLVIKKTEASSKFVTKVSPSSSADNTVASSKSALRPSCQPKIPKMIIRNARSRPGTPSIEAVPDEAPAQASVLERIVLAAHETREELYENDSESSLQSPASYKIPKMKIKLDEKHANKIVRAEDTAELGVKRKNLKKTIPKVKIKNSPRSEPSDNSIFNNATPEEPKSLERHEEKIPVLKLRKQERNRSSSPEVLRKRQSSSHSDVPTKRYKRSGRDDVVRHCTRRSNSDSARTAAAECETKRNEMCISEKIPKVIIKRTSASAEFKCELSKSGRSVIAKSAKWQPEVKLERYRVLDGMAKDLKSSSSLTPVSLRIIDKIFTSRRDSYWWRKERDLHRLSRSNSTSDLQPIKCKQRRMSDYDCKKIDDVSKDDVGYASSRNADSKDSRRSCSTPKKSASSRGRRKSTDERRKEDKRRSRSRDNNSRTEAKVVPTEKETIEKDQSVVRRSGSEKVTSQCDERKANDDVKREKIVKTEEDSSSSTELDQKTPPKHSSTTDFKTALKELKATSKTENCFVKSPGLSKVSFEEVEERTDKEQGKEVDLFLCKDDDKVTMKERLSSDMDIECILQDDAILLKEEAEDILNNFEMDAVIKIESSDESQTTIEILPASPDDSRSELEGHLIDDGDSEQLYPADAIPTQFELELEIADNSNIDLLDVSMPRLKPVTCYSSRRASIEEYGSQASKINCYSKPEPLYRDKNALGRGGRVEVDVEEIPPKFPCNKEPADSQAAQSEKKFCCNDSLIKEVLAAKETLKKCLSRCESAAKPKTVAEKKQGSSFDLKSLSETHPKSSDALQGCRGAVTPQTGSIIAVSNRPNKTESIANAEKSDKKHSKSSKSVNKRVKPADKRDEKLRPTLTGADTKGQATEDAHECTTISLKAFKRFSQAAASCENAPRVINLSEKRKRNPGDQKDTVPQSPRKEENKMSSYKIPKISRPTGRGSNAGGNAKEAKSKEDNMPILEPAVVVNLDAGSDRESSRSPPVITNQDSGDVTASKLADNDKVITSDKVESDMKDVHKKSEMSIADFVTQLAYHEKATIKHRRYCNLCERWFPTTSRHRRHLAGYQHRHIELTQRKTIHTLFMLFTGNPCSRLVPANVVRNDCAVGELTPLQIAVQDVTKSFDTEQSPKKQNDVDK